MGRRLASRVVGDTGVDESAALDSWQTERMKAVAALDHPHRTQVGERLRFGPLDRGFHRAKLDGVQRKGACTWLADLGRTPTEQATQSHRMSSPSHHRF